MREWRGLSAVILWPLRDKTHACSRAESIHPECFRVLVLCIIFSCSAREWSARELRRGSSGSSLRSSTSTCLLLPFVLVLVDGGGGGSMAPEVTLGANELMEN